MKYNLLSKNIKLILLIIIFIIKNKFLIKSNYFIFYNIKIL